MSDRNGYPTGSDYTLPWGANNFYGNNPDDGPTTAPWGLGTPTPSNQSDPSTPSAPSPSTPNSDDSGDDDGGGAGDWLSKNWKHLLSAYALWQVHNSPGHFMQTPQDPSQVALRNKILGFIDNSPSRNLYGSMLASRLQSGNNDQFNLPTYNQKGYQALTNDGKPQYDLSKILPMLQGQNQQGGPQNPNASPMLPNGAAHIGNGSQHRMWNKTDPEGGNGGVSDPTGQNPLAGAFTDGGGRENPNEPYTPGHYSELPPTATSGTGPNGEPASLPSMEDIKNAASKLGLGKLDWGQIGQYALKYGVTAAAKTFGAPLWLVNAAFALFGGKH